jgi:hypothetical protein
MKLIWNTEKPSEFKNNLDRQTLTLSIPLSFVIKHTDFDEFAITVIIAARVLPRA